VQPLPPGATIGVLGGGQLGRMLGFAARAMGYRIVVLDPDPACPAAAVADRVVVGAYDDIAAARELAAACDVATYELEHVDLAVVASVAGQVPVRPGLRALELTQDRLAERRFLEALGIPVTPWRAVSSAADVRAAAASLGYPLRLKAPFGGYDGRSQVRIAGPAEVDAAFARLAPPSGEPHPPDGLLAGGHLLAEAEVEFEAELSVVVARGGDGATAAFPVVANVHAAGILATTLVPAPVSAAVAVRATALASRVAAALDAIGVITAELFLLRDGALAVNELAPRVHNSGHWTIEGARTSQFEQHVRAICGLPLGDPAGHGPAAMVNLLGTGAPRAARLDGLADALADPLVHVHVYAKQRVFERRKMGHVMVSGTATSEEALDRAMAARVLLRWT
jgi:5-(carboxyamino)imidazole ribonucleotide synthase